MLVVVGGGCFGTYHARQLLRAVRSGQLRGERLLVVDRDPGCRAARELAPELEVEFERSDWLSFLRRWLPVASPADHLIPAPRAPHLLWEWLAGALGLEPAEAPGGWGLPYEVAASGAVFISAAAWRCPATCVEPAHCPVLHAPRDWDLGDLIEQRASALGHRSAIFRCLHLACGVGSVRVGEIQAACKRLGAGPGTPVLVATTSRCHAAVGTLRPVGLG